MKGVSYSEPIDGTEMVKLLAELRNLSVSVETKATAAADETARDHYAGQLAAIRVIYNRVRQAQAVSKARSLEATQAGAGWPLVPM